MNTNSTYIAGRNTVDSWGNFRCNLTASGNAETWTIAFEEYFCNRLNLRYINPIKMLQGRGTRQGEGFSIVAIQCTLIEFLESTIQGIKYRYARGEPLGPNEYSSSRDVFVSFLCNRTPFDEEFDEALAIDFYASIRCGLLHEARTKNGWKIRAGFSNSMINKDNKIVYRDKLQQGIDSFIDWYRSALPADSALQEAFIRKFDDLCD